MLTVLSLSVCFFVGYRNFFVTETFKVIEELQEIVVSQPGDSDENSPPSDWDDSELEADSELMDEIPMSLEDLKNEMFADLEFSELEILQIQTERLQWELKVVKFKFDQLNTAVKELKKEKQVRESSFDNIIKVAQTVIPLLVPLVTFKKRKTLDKLFKKKKSTSLKK